MQFEGLRDYGVLGGSWVVTSRVVSRATILITHIRGLTTPLITTHEPPSRLWVFRCRAGGTKGLHFEGSGLEGLGV